MKRFSLLLLVVGLTLSTTCFAQTTYTVSPESSISVDGASNKSDWSVKAEVISGSVELTDGAPSAASLMVLVADMKSGRALLMDRLMKGAFKADDHPEIRFEMTSAEAVGTDEFDVHGEMTMAGTTNPVTFKLLRSQTEAGLFLFAGKADLNMRDYDMDPPSAMFGALITKAEVVIHFNIVLSQ